MDQRFARRVADGSPALDARWCELSKEKKKTSRRKSFMMKECHTVWPIASPTLVTSPVQCSIGTRSAAGKETGPNSLKQAPPFFHRHGDLLFVSYRSKGARRSTNSVERDPSMVECGWRSQGVLFSVRETELEGMNGHVCEQHRFSEGHIQMSASLVHEPAVASVAAWSNSLVTHCKHPLIP